MRPRLFWSSALLAAVAVGGLIAIAFPYGLLDIETPADRERAWLLTTWTAGVLAICFGGAGLLSTLSPVSFRDVAEAGSVPAAIEAHRAARLGREPLFYNFAGWTVATGFLLLVVYFGGWLVLGR